MNLTQLLNELAQQNIRLSVDGDQVSVKAPRGALTPALRDRLAENKPAILALLRRESSGGALPRIQPQPQSKHLPFPLTDIQSAYWVGRMSEFDQGDVSMHFYAEVDNPELDVPRAEAAWRRMVERHDMLRSVIFPDGHQQVLESVPAYEFTKHDLRSAGAAEVERALEETRDALSHQVLPNDKWPAFDIRVSMLPDGRKRLHFSIDLVSIDASSLMLVVDEWTRTYFDPQTSMAPIDLSYRDYVLAELSLRETRDYQDTLQYWRERVQTLPAAPELPMAPNLGERKRTRFLNKKAKLDRASWERLKAAAASRDLTASAVLATAYVDVLAAWSANFEFSLNVTLFNRLPFHPQVDNILGDFTSMILLGVDGRPHDGFDARARRVQAQLWKDLEHYQVSGIQVLRELARAREQFAGAIMPIVFTNMLNLSAKGFAPIYTAFGRLGELAFLCSQTPQVWLDYQVHEDAEGLRLTWDTVDHLFPPGMVDDMLAAHCRLLQRLADDQSAWTTPQPLIPPAQLAQRAAVNATDHPIPDRLLHELFGEQAARNPDHPAVVQPGTRSLTYGELNHQASRVGNHLRSLGVRPNQLVAVVMEKGWEQVVAALGVQMAGGAYLPVDPTTPAERLKFLIEHGQVAVVLTQSRLMQALPWPAGLTCLAVDGPEIAAASSEPLARAQTSSDLAYVLYTSGSTGLPKGVMIEQKSVVNRMLDVNARLAIGPQDRCLALSALHHDLSVYDLFGMLAAGGTIVMPDATALREPEQWATLIESQRVTFWNSVPRFLEMLVEHLEGAGGDRRLASLRSAVLAGDWIPVTLPDRLRRLAPQVQVIASGGPTETTIWDIWYPVGTVDPAWRSIPYGRPMNNTRYHVLDAALRPRPTWVPGELYISGMGLARGYWRDEERTAAAFITHPQTGERLYRSGDLGRYLPDGNIEFLGRGDNQVKIGGVRIELEEIETALARHPRVRACAVVAQGDPRGSRSLAAFVVPQSEPEHEPPAELGSVLTDTAARIDFKLTHPGVRDDLGSTASIELPAPAGGDALSRAVEARRSCRVFAQEPFPVDRLGAWLGVARGREQDGLPRFAYPSAGSLYPVQLYLYVKQGRVQGLDGGTYYYHPFKHCLQPIAPGTRFPAAIHHEVNRPAFESSAFSIFLVGNLPAIEPMYGELARDFCLLEAGYLGELLGLAAPSAGLGLCAIGGFQQTEGIRDQLRLGPRQVLLHGHVAGALPEGGGDGALAPVEPPFSPATVLDFLRAKLPESMVPTACTFVDALPLTANGKVDRNALAQRRPVAEPEPDAPSGDLPDVIARVVGEVLGAERLSRNRSFFHLGATSVHLVRIAGQLRRVLGRPVAVSELFRHPTVDALAARLSTPADAPARAASSVQSRVDARRAARSRRGERDDD